MYVVIRYYVVIRCVLTAALTTLPMAAAAASATSPMITPSLNNTDNTSSPAVVDNSATADAS